MNSKFLDSITSKLKGRSIFLIGMMASGKSKTGPELAKLLMYKFIDLDSVIEKVTKKSINNIFNEDGESTFREIETKCLKEIINFPKMVISTGGGVIKKSQNWGILRQGIVIWIDVEKEIAIKRLNDDIDHRPLMKDCDIEKKYTEIFNERKVLYAQADLRIKVRNESIGVVVDKIIFEMQRAIK